MPRKADATVTIRPDISALVDALASIPNITEGKAKQMAIALEKQYKRAEQAAKATTDAISKQSSMALRQLEAVYEDLRRVELGDDAFKATRAIEDLDALEARLRETESLSEKATSAIAKRRSQLQRELADNLGSKLSVDVKKVVPDIDSAASATQRLGQRAGDAESGLRALGGVLGLVSPEAEKVVSTIAEFGGGLEGATRLSQTFGTSLSSILSVAGPVGVALGALAIAYAYLSAEEEKAAENAKRVSEEASNAQKVYEGLTSVTSDLADDVRLLTGEIDALGLEEERRKKQVTDAFAAQRDLQARTIKATEDEIEALRARARAGEDVSKELSQRRSILSQQLGIQGELTKREAEELDKVELVTLGKRAEADSRKSNTSAIRAETAAKIDQAALDAELEANIDAQLGLMTELEDRRKRAYTSQLSQVDQIRISLYDELDALDALADAYKDNLAIVSDVEATKVAVRREAEAQIEEIQRKEVEAAQRANEQINEDKRTAMQMAAEEFLKNNETTLNAYSDLAGRVMAVTSEFISQVSDQNRKAALAAYRVQQAVAIAQIAVNTLVAASRAVAELGPIAGAIAAGVIVATGAAQAALVAAQKPQFHTGGMLGNSGPPAPDEADVRIRRNEPVLTRQEAQNVAAVASGGGASGAGSMVIVQQYKHRPFDAFIQDNVARSTSPLRRAIKGGDRVGHRNRT